MSGGSDMDADEDTNLRSSAQLRFKYEELLAQHELLQKKYSELQHQTTLKHAYSQV